MDPIEARYLTLKLACRFYNHDSESDSSADNVLKTAKSWGEFVVGPAVRESKRAGEGKGADAEAAAARGEPV